VDRRRGTVLVVLHVASQPAAAVDAKDVAEARVLVERVRVDVVGGLFGGQQVDGACSGRGFRCLCYVGSISARPGLK
jgi:hypothetical protein